MLNPIYSGPSPERWTTLAWGAHCYLHVKRPALAHLIERVAANAQVEPRLYMAAILEDELSRPDTPAHPRVQEAAHTCIRIALQDTHRHQ